jgi:hypothetical protein
MTTNKKPKRKSNVFQAHLALVLLLQNALSAKNLPLETVLFR